MTGRFLRRVAVFSAGLLLALQAAAGAQDLAKAWALIAKGDREKAREIAEGALAKSRDEKLRGEALLVEALCEENGEVALKDLNRFVSEFPGHPLRWRGEMELGLHYYALGTYRGAAKHFQKMLDLRPSERDRVKGAYWLGLALEGAGDEVKARRQFEVVRANDEGTGLAELATLGLGDCLRAQGDYSGALAEYTRVITNYGRGNWTPCALYEAGACLEKLGRRSESNQLYGRLVKEFPTSFEATLVREKSRAAPREKAVASTAKKYTVQLGAFSQQSNANALMGLLKDEGVADVTLVQEERGGRTLFIVGVGEFATRETAERRGKELSTRFGLSYSIVAK